MTSGGGKQYMHFVAKVYGFMQKKTHFFSHSPENVLPGMFLKHLKIHIHKTKETFHTDACDSLNHNC